MKKLLILLLLISPLSFALPKFHSVNALGDLKIKITQVPASQRAAVIYSKGVRAYIKRGVMYVRQTENVLNYGRRGWAKIKIHQLRHLTALGKTSVDAKNIHSNHFNLTADDNGKIRIRGRVNLKRITADGPVSIKIHNIRSQTIIAHLTGSAYVELQGYTNKLRAKLRDHSQLNARKLRSYTIWIRAWNFSAAFLLPENALRAFACGNANIYYYKEPKYLTRDTIQSGNVLQAGWEN